MLEIKIENELFEDLRAKVNRQLTYICRNIDEEAFFDGEVSIKIKIQNEIIENNEKFKTPRIDYKVTSNLKKNVSEEDTIKFPDRVFARGRDGSFYLANYSGQQENMFEEEWR